MYIFLDMLSALAEGVVYAFSQVLHLVFHRSHRNLHAEPVTTRKMRADFRKTSYDPNFHPEPIFNHNYPILRQLYAQNSETYPTEWPENIQWRKRERNK
jgi:hypothetical protein